MTNPSTDEHAFMLDTRGLEPAAVAFLVLVRDTLRDGHRFDVLIHELEMMHGRAVAVTCDLGRVMDRVRLFANRRTP